MGYKAGTPVALDRACCTQCEAEVMIAYRKGKPFYLEADKTYKGYRVNVNQVAQVGLFHVPHACNWAAMRRRQRRQWEEQKKFLKTASTIDGKHYLMGGVHNDISKPYDVPCPTCGVEPVMSCRNLAATKSSRTNKHPHAKRVDDGLAKQGLGKWFDSFAGQFYIAPLQKE